MDQELQTELQEGSQWKTASARQTPLVDSSDSSTFMT